MIADKLGDEGRQIAAELKIGALSRKEAAIGASILGSVINVSHNIG